MPFAESDRDPRWMMHLLAAKIRQSSVPHEMTVTEAERPNAALSIMVSDHRAPNGAREYIIEIREATP